jgi:hypothetical protein
MGSNGSSSSSGSRRFDAAELDVVLKECTFGEYENNDEESQF